MPLQYRLLALLPRPLFRRRAWLSLRAVWGSSLVVLRPLVVLLCVKSDEALLERLWVQVQLLYGASRWRDGYVEVRV